MWGSHWQSPGGVLNVTRLHSADAHANGIALQVIEQSRESLVCGLELAYRRVGAVVA